MGSRGVWIPSERKRRRDIVKNRAAVDQQYREWLATQPQQPRKPRKRTAGCSEVTITRADGSVETRAPLSAARLREVAPERPPIDPVLRAKVLRRDRGTCRYCGNMDGPFEIDHVLPVSKGGATVLRNLVTACEPCNRRKGADIWKPVPLAKHSA